MGMVPTSTKVLYGLGFAARGIKDGLFQLFLFFYFSQVLGLDPALAGTASLLALLADAITDPMVGLLSDQWESPKWGRRHPFLFFSAIPLGIFTWLLFLPPTDLSQMGLFWWMTGFTILVRVALTFFLVPHMSLGAELSTDYKERTSITAYRIMFAAFISPVIMILGYTVYFVPTETVSNGLLNKAAYPNFAFLCGVLMIIFILISAWGTRHIIPTLPKASEAQKQLKLSGQFKNLGRAFQLHSFRSLVLFVMFVYVAIGIGVVFTPYFGPYFFGFTAQEMAALPIGSAVGSILALMIAPNLGERLDKKWGAMYSTIIFSFFFSLPFILRLLGLFPENGSSVLLPLYVFTLVIAYLFIWVTMSLANSMMADVVDEYELVTGNRQEGLFFATMSFAFKCTNGLGTFIAGLLLTWIAFPIQTDLSEVPEEVIQGLGYVGGPILLGFYLFSIIFIIGYPLTKSRYQEIRAGLDG